MNFLLLFIAIITSIVVTGQNQPPVAVNDTVPYPVHLRDTITVNFINNDYDPEGDPFFLLYSYNSISHTDSTITYYINPAYNYYKNGYLDYTYVLWDSIAPALGHGDVVMYLDEPFYDYLDINNIKARINSFGNHFWDVGVHDIGAEYYFPKDTTTSTLFNFSLWIGGLDESEDLHISAERYRSGGVDYWEGPLTTDGTATIDTATAYKYHRVWKLNIEDVEYHIEHWSDPGYEPIEAIATWPAHGDVSAGQSYHLAPFVDVNNNGDYVPLEGDYPLIRGDQSIFFIFNDQTDTTKREAQGLPIGIEIHGFAYAFNRPDNPALYNTTFLSYKIINRSQHTLNDTYVGIHTDIKLGYAWDDYLGCDVTRGVYYGYNGDDFDDTTTNQAGFQRGYGYNIPAQGVVILGGPYLDSDGEDNATGGCDESINGVGFGDGVVDNERHGMSSFMRFYSSAGVMGSPSQDYHYYYRLKTLWLDSTEMEYGGDGHPSYGAYGPAAKFMFPGFSDPCYWGTDGVLPFGPVNWTEITAGHSSGYRRGLASMGPFTLVSGGVEKIDIAFVTAPGDSTSNPVDTLMAYIDSVKAFYYEDPDHFGYRNLGNNEMQIAKSEINIYPNPASSVLYVQFEETSKDALCSIFDLYGKLIRQTEMSDERVTAIDISGLKQGIYFLQIKTNSAIISKKFIIR